MDIDGPFLLKFLLKYHSILDAMFSFFIFIWFFPHRIKIFKWQPTYSRFLSQWSFFHFSFDKLFNTTTAWLSLPYLFCTCPSQTETSAGSQIHNTGPTVWECMPHLVKKKKENTIFAIFTINSNGHRFICIQELISCDHRLILRSSPSMKLCCRFQLHSST